MHKLKILRAECHLQIDGCLLKRDMGRFRQRARLWDALPLIFKQLLFLYLKLCSKLQRLKSNFQTRSKV